MDGWDVVDMVANNRTRYQKLTEAEKREVDAKFAKYMGDSSDDDVELEMFQDNENEFDNDFRPEDVTVSDVEDDVFVELSEDKFDEEDDDAIDSLRLEATDCIAALPQADLPDKAHFISKNGTKWYKDQPATSRIRAHNIFDLSRCKPGPSKSLPHNPLEIFRSLFTEDIANIIIRETNRKARQVITAWKEANPGKPKEWKPFNLKEFDAFLAIILHAGLCKSNSEPAKELWGSTRAPIYKAALPYDRFVAILKFIRFDNVNSRAERLLNSKTAAIDDLWLMLQANLAKAYNPHESITVDEQLFPYRGRTRFTQYIPSKPAKYGIKVWWLCDSKSYYPLKGIIYAGKMPGQLREVNQGQNVVTDLVEKYLDVGRTVYADNFFSTLDVAKILMRRKTAFVGTVRSNKTFVPPEFLKSNARPISSTLFGFHEGDISLCSYVPKKNTSVLLMSSMHYTCDVDYNNKKKPMAILDYNAHKCGVDTMDQMLGTYTCKRSTKRWPLAMFYNMVDIAALAAFIIYDEMSPGRKSDKRRAFLLLLTKQLAVPNIEERAKNSRITRYPKIRSAMEAFDVMVSN